jgi:hypothetical protein
MDHDPSRAPQWPGGSPNNIDSRDAPQPQVDGGHELSHRTLVMSGANDDEYFDFDKYIQSPNPGLGGE